jgi:hypothetical protein
MVAPVAASASMDSAAGMEAAVPSARRVRMTDWATPGTVSSHPAVAAAAAIELTPGTISKARPWARHHAICSATAL